jgi:hypothetical protein
MQNGERDEVEIRGVSIHCVDVSCDVFNYLAICFYQQNSTFFGKFSNSAQVYTAHAYRNYASQTLLY